MHRGTLRIETKTERERGGREETFVDPHNYKAETAMTIPSRRPPTNKTHRNDGKMPDADE